MTIELARRYVVTKPWGVADPGRWLPGVLPGAPVGEIWFERASAPAHEPSLLLKLLFTSEPLSIQVHPDDAYAKSMGLANGKTEAWCVLSAAPHAVVGLGLDREMTQTQLRLALQDGSISNCVAWHEVAPGDALSVPAGTIHAIGAGLVIAEIQQRSDATFRLFDYGRQRELHIDDAVAMAVTGPAELPEIPEALSEERKVLATSPYFVFERIVLAADTAWRLDAEKETWLLVLDGGGSAGSIDLSRGDVVFAQSDTVDLQAGPEGVTALAAYATSRPLPQLLRSSRSVRPPHAAGPKGELPRIPAASSQFAPASRHSGLSS